VHIARRDVKGKEAVVSKQTEKVAELQSMVAEAEQALEDAAERAGAGAGSEVVRQAHPQFTVNTTAVVAKCGERGMDQAQAQLHGLQAPGGLPAAVAGGALRPGRAGWRPGRRGRQSANDVGNSRRPDPVAAAFGAQLREALEQVRPLEFTQALRADLGGSRAAVCAVLSAQSSRPLLGQAELAGIAERRGIVATPIGVVAGADVGAHAVAPREVPSAEARCEAAPIDLGSTRGGELDLFDCVQLDGDASGTVQFGLKRRPGAEVFIPSVGARPGRHLGKAKPGKADSLDSERAMSCELMVLDWVMAPLAKQMQQRSSAEGAITSAGVRRRPGADRPCSADPLDLECEMRDEMGVKARVKAPLGKQITASDGVVAGDDAGAPAVAPCGVSVVEARGAAALIGIGPAVDCALDPVECAAEPGSGAPLGRLCELRAELVKTDRGATPLFKQRPAAVVGVIVEMTAEFIARLERIGQLAAGGAGQARLRVVDASRSEPFLATDSDGPLDTGVASAEESQCVGGLIAPLPIQPAALETRGAERLVCAGRRTGVAQCLGRLAKLPAAESPDPSGRAPLAAGRRAEAKET
ncbi:unnamed protein product, partial [Prorocentrum cordatum]